MFTDTMRRWLEPVRDLASQFALSRLLYPLFDRESSTMLTSAGLEQDASTASIVDTGGSACYYFANGVYGQIAANTDMAALVGTVANGTINVFCFFVDSAGALTSAMGTAGATRAAVVFPQFPEGKALIGFVEIRPTGTGSFVGGTTALNDGTVVPNAAYINGTSGFDPYVLTGLSATP